MNMFKNRNYVVLFSGQLVSAAGNNLFAIALPWFVLSATGSKQALVLTGVAENIPVVIGLFAGVLVDRWVKKTTMIVSDFVRGLISLVLFAIAFLGHPSVLLIAFLVLLLQSVGTVFRPADVALTTQVVPRDLLPQVSGVQQSATATVSLAATAGGGVLLSVLGAPILFLLNAISFACSCITLFFVRAKEPERLSKPTTSFVTEWIDGLKAIMKSRMILRIVLAGVFVNFAGTAMSMVLTVWIKQVLHGTAYMFGFVMTASIVGVIVGGLLAGIASKHISVPRLMMIGLLAIGVFIALMAVSHSYLLLVVWMVLCGLAQGLLNSSLGAMAMQVIPQHLMGRIIGTLQSSMSLSQPLGVAVFGSLLLMLPTWLLFLLIGLFPVIGGLMFVRRVVDDAMAMSATETM